MDFKWEDPPPAKTGGAIAKWPGIVEELKQRPGEWARFDHYKHQKSARSSGFILVRNFPGLEYTTREGVLYLRWNPAGEDEPTGKDTHDAS